RTPMNRAAFRATLTAVWLILNAALFVVYILNGTFTMHEGLTFLYLLPTIPLALKVGGCLHTRVSEWWFRISLQSLLLLSAAALLF
ncbi:MAG TPA: hypothetical protein PLY93_15440, partial [Turneriella sp.]|nr:hypothetical protein [Turneriella sp.]